jgi:hypothetical protein
MQNASDVTDLVKIAGNFRFTADRAFTEHYNLEDGFPDPGAEESLVRGLLINSARPTLSS